MEGDACLASFIDRGSVESHRYFLARRTVLEMLRDRGYAVPAEDIDLSLAQFRSIYGQEPELQRLRISAYLRDNCTEKVLVLFCGPAPVTLPLLRVIIASVEIEISRLILILEQKPTASAREAIKSLPYKAETFQIEELLVNVTKHVLMPTHQILSEEDKQSLLKHYNVKENQLPHMLASDALARYYGLGPGSVIKVTHIGDDIGQHVTYRCVI
ncbi:DNA-directed RNA polymerase V subunit 5A-like [Wolffia australiana]